MKTEYKLLDSGNFKKLESIGSFIIIRPALGAVWKPFLPDSEWNKADAVFERGSKGDGKWRFFKKNPPASFLLKIGSLSIQSKLTDFGHIGLFPEHHLCQDLCQSIEAFYKEHKRPFRLLNLFAYTGIASLLAASHGAEVVHVDASKTSVAWARENASLSGLEDKPVRWIVDDAMKFVSREVKRGSSYDGILLDPPSYGRGFENQIWKIEDHLLPLLDLLTKIMSDDFAYIKLSAHTAGYSPITLENVLLESLEQKLKNKLNLHSYEMCIEESRSSGRRLPSGACAIASRSFS